MSQSLLVTIKNLFNHSDYRAIDPNEHARARFSNRKLTEHEKSSMQQIHVRTDGLTTIQAEEKAREWSRASRGKIIGIMRVGFGCFNVYEIKQSQLYHANLFTAYKNGKRIKPLFDALPRKKEKRS